MTRYSRIVVASYRLPYGIEHDIEGDRVVQNTGGLVSAMLSLVKHREGDNASSPFSSLIWAGVDKLSPKDLELMNRGQSECTIVPVDIPPVINDRFYNGFSNNLIWPLFHSFPSFAIFSETSYESYVKANTLFADALLQEIRDDDFIWIHDYQLFLVPGLVREKRPHAHIGFFLHIPFPPFELFRMLPRQWREAILQGMLGADLVGFHTFDYCQNFQKAVSRILNHDITMNTVLMDDRIVKFDSFPISIDYDKFSDAAANSTEVNQVKASLSDILSDQKLIFSVDRLDYTKGFLNRLEGFEYFLEHFPEWREDVVFNMVVVPSRDKIPKYNEMKKDIEAMVGRINGKYGTIAWHPIIYQYKSLSFNELIALYSHSHVALITPIRDGMNLVSKEYVACQSHDKGVLILSEMAGAAAELSEALIINPTDRKEMATALNRALTMPQKERALLMDRMQKRIKTYDVFAWTQDFISSMDDTKKEQEMSKVTIMNTEIRERVIAAYTAARQRVIFLDYDGTLVPFSKYPELAVPSEYSLNQLKALATPAANAVVIISGRSKEFLNEWFSGYPVHLIAEHGAFTKAPGAEWACELDPDAEWKKAIAPVLQRYYHRCSGSFVEEKAFSLAWHFRNSPQEIAAIKAKELTEELRTLIVPENRLQVLEGEKVIEIKRAGYDKGVAASRFLTAQTPDFILALGDDKTDEDLFRALPAEAHTIKIGLKTTRAKYNLKSQQEVHTLLDKLITS
ncbi:MAG: hypothetical protein A2268_16795 [Candidatus Raymondbacteria bacterium RifOxyA12_full_50_37]|uniref:Uncharacterized protein n=1 Tax=Candidatus Raymondbacteria bacterium RIFOXYD12_FULL_49_13 TaxID=1817890 RepID=A0A1F7FCK3_UNCRA|nr:MAG: hypothetical protein A2268_16795 [Candidatus Raymondbacteria bacterium RifOxyA12_full_50_37]OGJ86268.1 MAG: hypothetical protein A2248_16390 [Candidatus Raymondbacteria bacterium RIFOXYA2_FULL_49_16]OGJ93628.1 MAG: hypothetical protein A2487_20220 [Candidatus Raymondbacteria bacterium RifOxyC12_full_50_8]OGJ95805.1 MAG: hypothetical protein A2453_11705 [Candidatus Raymondbacteria bacterium RIFOXYC2_FULL_50_21]OGJ95936.1 MAG: hypothetical protein A2350_15920 [Candidatus Raymondbacteria b